MRLWSTKPSSVSRWTDGLRSTPRARPAVTSRARFSRPTIRTAGAPSGSSGPSASGPGGKDHAVAEAWAIAFGGADGHVATKTTVPFERARFSTSDIGATVDGCTLSADGARGRVESGGRAIAYDLTIASLEAPLVHFQKPWMYERGLPKQKIVSPIPNARISGTVVVEGETSTLDAWPGMVGHDWGAGNSESYAWGRCNAWDDGDDVVFEGFSARVRAGGVLLPTTTALCLRHHGTSYMLSGLAALATNHGAISARRWRFRGESRRVAIEGEMWADTEDFVGLFYPNPQSHRLLLPQLEARARRDHGAHRGPRPEDAPLRAGRPRARDADPHHGVRMYV